VLVVEVWGLINIAFSSVFLSNNLLVGLNAQFSKKDESDLEELLDSSYR
jgi:maltodextrin utilization protein YvdJ